MYIKALKVTYYQCAFEPPKYQIFGVWWTGLGYSELKQKNKNDMLLGTFPILMH